MNYLPLSGGTITGRLFFSYYDASIAKSTTDATLFLGGGLSWDTGAGLFLNGKDKNGGEFCLASHDGTNYNALIGNNDGSLSWCGKNIVRSVNGIAADASGNVSEIEESDLTVTSEVRWIRYTNGIQICFGHHVHDSYVTLPKPFKDNTYVINGTLNSLSSSQISGSANAIVGAFLYKSTTGFHVVAINAMTDSWANGFYISWIAFGLWK